jgi:hypothetical protein
MDAGHELPLPAAQIVEHLNVRPRIPLSPWSLKVATVALIARPDRPPLVEIVLQTSSATTASENWSVRFAVKTVQTVQAEADKQAFLLFLKVRLEEWWLNRAGHPEVQARRLN